MKKKSAAPRAANMPDANRRRVVRGLLLSGVVGPALFEATAGAQIPTLGQLPPDETIAWVCPMHSDYTAMTSGVCPYCGMDLVRARPFDVRPYRLEVETAPAVVRAGEKTTLRFRAYRPGTDAPVKAFYWVHTKQWHQFVISEDLEHYQHIHPAMASDGTWSIDAMLPRPGYYELIADFFPSEGSAQLLSHPLITAGYAQDLVAGSAHLVPETYPLTKTAKNLSATIDLDPPQLVAGLTCRVNFHVKDSKTGEPVTDLQTYLGAFGHAFVMSEDRVDYVHVHPLNVLIGSQEDGAPPIFLIPPDADLDAIRGGPDITFEALMPRPGKFRMWVQMQRHDTVELFVLTFNVIAAVS